VTGCRFVHDHQAEHAVRDLCRVIELPRSTYYAWLNHEPSQRAWEDNVLLGEIKEIHTLSRHTYGAPRILGQLRHRGHRVGRHRVARIMVEHGLVGVHGRKKWRRGKPNTAYAPDLLERDFSASRPDERWVADISEFHCLDGKLFLAGIRDLFDKTLVGWAMGERQTTDLVVSALVMALSRRRPDGELVHHSDKGPQYTSLELANHLSDWGLSASFGSTGDAYDNAAMESFWATAKREIEFLHGPVRQLAKSQLRTIIFEYVEVFYNRERHQAVLGHLTPAEYYATSKVA
jgi:transposase InsO family protein